MKIVHMVICRGCGYPAFEIKGGGTVRQYYCKRCDLKFIDYGEDYSLQK